VAIAPGEVVFAVQHADPGVVPVFPTGDLGVISFKGDRLLLDIPMDAVRAETGVDVHADGPAVTPEDAGKAIPEGDNGAVKDAVGQRHVMPGDDRVAAVPPDRSVAAGRPVLPGNVGEGVSDDFRHGD